MLFSLTGITVKMFIGIRSLEVAFEVDKSLEGSVSGLLGNFNGKKTDEFMLPNGAVLHENITERQLFEEFGKACKQ